jgi:Bacterial regulatory proteins, gntR family
MLGYLLAVILDQTVQTRQMSQTLRTVQTVCAGQTVFAIMVRVPASKPREPRPPSQRVEADLRARIGRNEWAPGERLPPVAELAGYYGVARSTVVNALRRIEASGLIEIVPNWGTFMREPA